MDVDPLRDQATTCQQFGQAEEARDFGLAFVTDNWLEEHVRLMGAD